MLARKTYNDVLREGVCPEMRPVGLAKKNEKGQKLSCVKLAIFPDHPRRRSPVIFCVRGPVWDVVTYFRFHENRWRVSEQCGSKIAL